MTSSLSPVVAHDSLPGCSSFVKMLSCCEHTVVHERKRDAVSQRPPTALVSPMDEVRDGRLRGSRYVSLERSQRFSEGIT
jgi:hypothetical protein